MRYSHALSKAPFFKHSSTCEEQKKTILNYEDISSELEINMNVNNATIIIKYLSQTDPCLGEIIRSVGNFSIKIRKDPEHIQDSLKLDTDIYGLGLPLIYSITVYSL